MHASVRTSQDNTTLKEIERSIVYQRKSRRFKITVPTVLGLEGVILVPLPTVPWPGALEGVILVPLPTVPWPGRCDPCSSAYCTLAWNVWSLFLCLLYLGLEGVILVPLPTVPWPGTCDPCSSAYCTLAWKVWSLFPCLLYLGLEGVIFVPLPTVPWPGRCDPCSPAYCTLAWKVWSLFLYLLYLGLEGVILVPLVVRPVVMRVAPAVAVSELLGPLHVGVLEVVALVVLLGDDDGHYRHQQNRCVLHTCREWRRRQWTHQPRLKIWR